MHHRLIHRHLLIINSEGPMYLHPPNYITRASRTLTLKWCCAKQTQGRQVVTLIAGRPLQGGVFERAVETVWQAVSAGAQLIAPMDAT